MKPTKQNPETQKTQETQTIHESLKDLPPASYAAIAEYAISKNPNGTFAQKHPEDMTQNEAIAHFLNI